MAESYPHLNHLLSGYLHQDYIVVSGSLEGAIDDFLKLESADSARGLRADLEDFLARHGAAPLAAFNHVFPHMFHIGDDDDQARAWLEQVLARVGG